MVTYIRGLNKSPVKQAGGSAVEGYRSFLVWFKDFSVPVCDGDVGAFILLRCNDSRWRRIIVGNLLMLLLRVSVETH